MVVKLPEVRITEYLHATDGAMLAHWRKHPETGEPYARIVQFLDKGKERRRWTFDPSGICTQDRTYVYLGDQVLERVDIDNPDCYEEVMAEYRQRNLQAESLK